MIYCSCGGQKNCYRCDGKGWIDDSETESSSTNAAKITLPPVRKELSRMPEPDYCKTDWGRIKPLIAKIKQATGVPRSSSNIEAARAKKRKLAKLARKLDSRPASQQFPSVERKTQTTSIKPPGSHGRVNERDLTDEQRALLFDHEREIENLTRLLQINKTSADYIQQKILEEKKAIRKIWIKARRAKRKRQCCIVS